MQKVVHNQIEVDNQFQKKIEVVQLQKIELQKIELQKFPCIRFLVSQFGLRLVLLVVPYELLKLGCWVVIVIGLRLESLDLSFEVIGPQLEVVIGLELDLQLERLDLQLSFGPLLLLLAYMTNLTEVLTFLLFQFVVPNLPNFACLVLRFYFEIKGGPD